MKNITLEESVASGRVFVLNKSKPKGEILITFVHPGSGKSFGSKIPKTWIPMAVSDNVPLKVIADSIDFRSYLSSGMLKLISRDEAESILESSDSREEVERLSTKKHVDEDEDDIDEKGDAEVKVSKKLDINRMIEDENLIVKDILERNVDSKISVILNELKSVEDELKESDFIYVIKNTEGKLRDWAEKKVNKKPYTGAKRGRKPKVAIS